MLIMASISNCKTIYYDASCHIHTLGLMICEPNVQKWTVTTATDSDKNTFPWGSGVQICKSKQEGTMVAKLSEPIIVISTV